LGGNKGAVSESADGREWGGKASLDGNPGGKGGLLEGGEKSFWG